MPEHPVQHAERMPPPKTISDDAVFVRIGTELGDIIAAIYQGCAPATANAFLNLVDMGLYADATFYRTVRRENTRGLTQYKIVQGGIDPTCEEGLLPCVSHEPTSASGLSHLAGTISLAQSRPGTGSSEFFIVVEDACQFDSGGRYGEGFAAFGRVLKGLEVVIAINELPITPNDTPEYMAGQALCRPIRFSVTRWLGDAG